MEAKIYLERYRLYVDPIGLPVVIRRSASEATFKAQDTIEHKDVALQVVSVTTLRSVVREQLEAEAKGAQQIQDINIPVLHDFGFDDGQIVYVTEYFDGVTADEWIKAHGPMPVGAVLRIAQQMVNASSVSTFHGIVHHAINPRNVMLVPGQTPDGEWPLIKVLNFVGVAPDL
ncbi:MAG: protein kinase, partial [Verrucomicrobiota bacterium]|nr:protein kinase [Verrucomicrobiota bacterium]